jgi:hypothetical protein
MRAVWLMEHRFQIYFDVLFIDVMNTKETERKVMSWQLSKWNSNVTIYIMNKHWFWLSGSEQYFNCFPEDFTRGKITPLWGIKSPKGCRAKEVSFKRLVWKKHDITFRLRNITEQWQYTTYLTAEIPVKNDDLLPIFSMLPRLLVFVTLLVDTSNSTHEIIKVSIIIETT